MKIDNWNMSATPPNHTRERLVNLQSNLRLVVTLLLLGDKKQISGCLFLCSLTFCVINSYENKFLNVF